MSENALRFGDCRRGMGCSVARVSVFAALIVVGMGCRALRAQDIAGTWQGSMQVGKEQVGKEQRIVLKIAKSAGAGWQGVVYSLDSGRTGLSRGGRRRR